MEYARAAGFPAPAVHHVTETDMVLERLDGPTMLADFARRPWMLRRHARTLAALHRRLHAIQAPDWLSRSLGEGNRLLHLDLHPDNVILAGRGPVVIDWANARRGPGPADVALVWVIAATSVGQGAGYEAWAARTGVSWFLSAFLGRFDRTELQAHLPLAVDFRLADPAVDEGERRAVRAFADRQGLG